VAGYDLGKLHQRAGTLGVITQATFKVAPLPARSETIQLDASLDELMSITARISDGLLAVGAIVLFKVTKGLGWSLLVRFAGGAAAVERSRNETASMLTSGRVKAPERELRGPALLRLLTSPVVARASVVPAFVVETCEALSALNARVAAYPTAGIIYGAWEPDGISAGGLRELRRLCVGPGLGALVLERGPLELKREVGVWGEPRDDFELMRRLKAELDPKGILNPGRYLGGI
jgi:glycolate oxidase FAD binding subunit